MILLYKFMLILHSLTIFSGENPGIIVQSSEIIPSWVKMSNYGMQILEIAAQIAVEYITNLHLSIRT